MTAAEDKLAHARAAAISKAPYFASAIYGFVFVETHEAGTMFCTPKLVLGYNPDWVAEATTDELAADIVHEVHHVMRQHFVRGEHVDDPALFGLAADLSINPDLRDEGWKLANASSTRPAVYPKDLGLPEKLTAEEYYNLLRQQKEDEKKKDEGDGDGDGDQPGGKKPPPKGVAQGKCGGICGGPQNAALEKQLDGTPELGRDKAEIQSIGKRVANDIKQHVAAKGRGSIPSNLIDWVDTFDEEMHVRWQDELAHILRDTSGRLQSGGDDFSLSRPSKRSFMRGILRPGMVEHLPEVAIIRDTSGSMGAQQLMDATRESFYIMAALGIDEVWFADADTQVATPWRRVGAQFFRDLREAHGRGGTDFRQGIESALQLSPKPDLIVYVTDGDGTTTAMPPPDVAVVWAIVPSHYNMAPANWGHCVLITDDPKKRKAGPRYPTPTVDDD